MKNKKILYVVQLSLGIALLFLGAVVFSSDNQRLLSGLCYGVGSAMLVLASGNLFFTFRISEAENEKIQQLKQIEVNDERNTRIREKSGQMVAKIMFYVLLVFVLLLAFMQVDQIIVLLSGSLLIIYFILLIFFTNYFSKRT